MSRSVSKRMKMVPEKFQFAIDRGGTFTDVFARCPGGKIRVLKLLSEDPQHYEDAPTEGIRRVLREILRCIKYTDEQHENKYKEKFLEVMKLYVMHMEHRDRLYENQKGDAPLPDNELIDAFIQTLPGKSDQVVLDPLWSDRDLRPFISKPVMDHVDSHLPLDYLTEMRQITIQFINVRPILAIDDVKIVQLVNDIFTLTCKSVEKLFGTVNKLSVFDKNVLLLVLFGLKSDGKHEWESRNALTSAYSIRDQLLKVEGVEIVSVAVTNGMVYSGVIGHPTRRDYTVVGHVVNKAFKMTGAYKSRVTCDHGTFKNSKLPSCRFHLQSPDELRGIEDNCNIFEYNETFDRNYTGMRQSRPIIGRDVELELIMMLLSNPERINNYKCLIFRGPAKVGKTKLLQASFIKCKELGHPVASVDLCGLSARPYYCVSALYKELYNSKAEIGTPELSALSSDLWNLNEIFQNSQTLSETFMGELDKTKKVQVIFKQMLRKSETGINIFIIDNIQRMDMQSWQLLSSSLHGRRVRIISAGNFAETNWDLKWKLSRSNYVKMVEMSGIEATKVPALACQLLKVNAIPTELANFLCERSEGQPGWVQSYLLRLMNRGSITIKYASNSAIDRKEYYFLEDDILKSSHSLIQSDSLPPTRKTMAIAAFTGKYNDSLEVYVGDITMDLFDSLTPYEQLIVKTGAVLGSFFTRDMLRDLTPSDTENFFVDAIQRLFEFEIFECNSKYISTNGIFGKKLGCYCHFDEDDEVMRKLKTTDEWERPKYAHCKFIHFKNIYMQKVAYDLLPDNLKQELHLRITDILEQQPRSCPICIRDQSAPIIILPKYGVTVRGCDTMSYESMSLANRQKIDKVKNVIRSHVRGDLTEGESASKNKKEYIRPRRRVWDASICFCIEFLTRLYTDLIWHSEKSEHLGKRIFYRVQYATVMMYLNEWHEAITSLSEALDICIPGEQTIAKATSDERTAGPSTSRTPGSNVPAPVLEPTVSKDFIRLFRGKIQRLLAECYLCQGNLAMAKSCVLYCLKQYKVTVSSLTFSKPKRIMFKYFLARSVPQFIYYQPTSMENIDLGSALNLFSQICVSEGEWNLAMYTSVKSLSLLRAANTSVNVLCDAYANAINLYTFCGNSDMCQRLIKAVDREVLQNYCNNVTIELYSISRLMAIIFQCKILFAHVTHAIQVGNKCIDINNTIHAYRIQVIVMPVLASVLLNSQRIKEAVTVVNMLHIIGKTQDESALIAYYAFCIELHLETCFELESIPICAKFCMNYFTKKPNRPSYTDMENKETGKSIERTQQIDTSLIEWIRMGTTVATNALLERKGEPMAFVTNKNIKDILLIGNQARPKIFDLNIRRPEVLYKEVIEIDCRVIPEHPRRCKVSDSIRSGWRKVQGSAEENVYVVKELDEKEVEQKLKALQTRNINSIAVALAHSYIYHEHEVAIGKIAKELGFKHISLSSEVMPMLRIVPRGFTACADAYLTPHVKRYLEGFSRGFKNNLEGVRVLFMQSDGGLTPMKSFNGARAILSGPAGGVVGYALTTWQKETDLPVIGFDMGGTSTDVSRYAGIYEHVIESTTAGVTIQAPQLDVNTVAAGGGSMLFFRSGLFVVGPESAGAQPGPACYKKGGPLTVTDANLLLGRLLPEYFPSIFGPNEDAPLDKSKTLTLFKELTKEINAFLGTQDSSKGQKTSMTLEEVAMGFVDVANEAMCRPIRALTQARGYDTARHALACFGGAGGQHACAIARSLGMTTVFVHKYAGILSAYGMALADVVHEAQEPCAKEYKREHFRYFEKRLDILGAQCKKELINQGFKEENVHLDYYLHLRYEGTDCALMCTSKPGKATKHGDFEDIFLERYNLEFGFTIPDRNIMVDDIRVRGVGKTDIEQESELASSKDRLKVEKLTKVYFAGGFRETGVYLLENLAADDQILGPAIIMDKLSTILVEPNCTAVVTKLGDIKITIGSGKLKEIGPELDSIQLSIFSHRFMSIAEQMGRILQRTSISTNIKERLDFSCALFGPDGGLVSNAPHIPVHLGSMQEAVQYQMKTVTNFVEGDVILSNHPSAGGSHLPDLTVITPVFDKSTPKPVFFVASRGHHADIGGITPGSMPPHSTSLSQEGASFKSFFLVKAGAYQDKAITDRLKAAGSRNLNDNLSDLRAQIAANQKGIALVGELISQYGLKVVQAYMNHIQTNAELAVRDMLKKIAADTLKKTNSNVLSDVEYLDNGTPIKLTITLDGKTGSAKCDFTGTGPEVWGNLNAPRAITYSALIYCLRCMVGHDVPLNQGCLAPINVVIPKGCILDPSDTAAVVGGNVQTSQRLVDVVLKAFQVCAASQGCMNNITFGDETWGCYETVAGGSGAGPGWHGCSGVHTHMTNTRITDIEVLERRYPVHIRSFMLRPNSGGSGLYRGGCGVIRELFFRSPVTLSVLTERRVLRPYGLNGGNPGAMGLNYLIRADGRLINLGPKTAVDVAPGDVFQLHTPGGGGWGTPDGSESPEVPVNTRDSFVERGSVFEYRKAQESV